MFPYYSGHMDPTLYESEVQTTEEVQYLNAVECPNGCGFWRGDLLSEGCPECGEDCHEVEPDE